MSAEKIIRSQAREKLRTGGWTKAIIGLAVITIFYMAIECIAQVEYILCEIFTFSDSAEFAVKVLWGSLCTGCALLLSPVLLGYVRMFNTDSNSYDIKDIMYYFSDFRRYAKAITYIFSLILRMIIPTLLCSVLAIALVVGYKFLFNEFMGETLYTFLLILFWASAVFNALRYSTRYALSFYLMCKDESKPVSYYFRTSKDLMRGHEHDIAKLFDSFFLWMLLCITVLPLLYVLPYITQSVCLSAKWISQLSRNE